MSWNQKSDKCKEHANWCKEMITMYEQKCKGYEVSVNVNKGV